MGITRSLLPQNQGELLLPRFGLIFRLILHGSIRQNYHKTVKSITFSPHFGKVPYFHFKLPHSKFSEKFTKISISLKDTRILFSKTSNTLQF